ncbi:MAG: DUF1049 domain-containing protein [Candidatus Omnitrophica bacterium]|nr:DUF1049 domain-containing protein [Candidatus Omnitrophota bacterium]
MRFFTVIKVIIVMLLTTLTVIFVSQNTSPVMIQHPFGHSEKFGLIHVMVFMFLLGSITGVFLTLWLKAKFFKEEAHDDEDEDLVDDE